MASEEINMNQFWLVLVFQIPCQPHHADNGN